LHTLRRIPFLPMLGGLITAVGVFVALNGAEAKEPAPSGSTGEDIAPIYVHITDEAQEGEQTVDNPAASDEPTTDGELERVESDRPEPKRIYVVKERPEQRQEAPEERQDIAKQPKEKPHTGDDRPKGREPVKALADLPLPKLAHVRIALNLK
jgi:hypothetical protein